MSDPNFPPSEEHRLYNRKERRDMRKRGILVRYRANGEQIVCYHDLNHWCQECINPGREVEIDHGDGEISTGRIFTNMPENEIPEHLQSIFK